MQTKERGEDGKKRLVAIHNRLKKLQPMEPCFKIPLMKSASKSNSERKRNSRNAMSVEAREMEKERNRSFIANKRNQNKINRAADLIDKV